MRLKAYKHTRQNTPGAVILTNQIIRVRDTNYIYGYFFSKAGSWYQYNTGCLIDVNSLDIDEWNEPFYINISKKEFDTCSMMLDFGKSIAAAVPERA